QGGPLPAGLQVSRRGDPYEQEAAHVAAHIVRTPTPAAQPAESDGESRVRSEGGQGQPLPPGLRARFEAHLGAGLGAVRLHTGSAAAAAAQRLNARAFTLGQDVVLGAGQYRPDAAAGQRLLAHELVHTVQQQQHPGLAATLQREEFEPWPGLIGTDVPGTRQRSGDVLRERIQRTGDPNYDDPLPILLEFNQAACTLTSTMDIHFVEAAEESARLSSSRFDALKARMLEVANDRLNGWMTIQVGDQPACTTCRGKTISVKVVAREGTSADASVVELRRGTGRANAGRIYAGGYNWLEALVGGVSTATLWHEAGHIVLGLDDEYPPLPGDPPRERKRINESDWSVMASSSVFGRRAVMHPRHFNFMTAWLGRRFPNCRFELVAQPQSMAFDVVVGMRYSAVHFRGGWGLGESLELSLGVPLDQRRRFRYLVGAYGGFLGGLEDQDRFAFLAGLATGLDFSTNRSAGGFAARAELQLGGTNLALGAAGREQTRWVPTTGAGLGLGYAGPLFEIGLTGTVGSTVSGPLAGEPFYLLGLRAAFNF
ncbi:MAG TPA: DUF4157 domain-containing protein, partial [Anaerolineae bacterium]|nr:DUF4157 domain-containing protein [Anaerolineae bacterium]